MAKVTGPFLSLSARGTVAKVLTASMWKGIAYMKEWFVPHNPKSAKQVNIRTAVTLLVSYWQGMSDALKLDWDTFASGQGMSGFNKLVSRAIDSYMVDPGIDVTPTDCNYDNPPPNDTWTWNAP